MDPINTKRIPQIIQFLQTQNQTKRRDDKSTFCKPYYLTCDTNGRNFFQNKANYVLGANLLNTI